jgi:hypothetical protein
MALIDELALELSVNLHQTLAGTGRSTTALRKAITKRDDLVIATFVETANATGAINYTLSAGALQREGVNVAKTEAGAGRTWAKIHGFILLVEPVNPADLTGNPVGLSYTWAGTTIATVQSLHNGLFVFLADVAFTDAAFTLNLDFAGAGSTKKKVTGAIIGSAV